MTSTHDEPVTLALYAVKTYTLPSASSWFLLLQDSLGVDVTVLICAMYLASLRNTFLDTSDIAAADNLVVRWRSTVIEPLRSMRRQMGADPSLNCSEMTSNVREIVKQAELSAEMAALDLLATYAPSIEGRETRVMTRDSLIWRVARFYASKYGRLSVMNDPEVQSAIEHLALLIRT